MSTLKKVLSLVLCISLLAGSFTMLGGLATVASAEETEFKTVTPAVKSYAELCKDNSQFVYFATEIREIEVDNAGNVTADNGATDGYVQPGQWLEYRAHVKSDMWVSTIVTGIQYDNRFFDTKSMSKPVVSATYENSIPGEMNADHPMVTPRGITVKYTVKPASEVNQFKSNYTALNSSVYANLDDAWQTCTYDANQGGLASDLSSDTWIYKWYTKVQDEPTVATGRSYSEPTTWKISPLNKNPDATTGDPKVNSNLATGALLSAQASAPARNTCKNMNLSGRYGVVTVLLNDTDFTFVVTPTAKFVVDGELVGEAVEYKAGEEIAVPEDPVAPAGQKFLGWKVEGTVPGEGQTEEDLVVTNFLMGTKNVTYVPVFGALENEKATFIANGEEFATYETYAGGMIEAPANKPADIENGYFKHWSTTEGGEAVTDWTMPKGGATFYAVYEITEAVTYKVRYIVKDAEYTFETYEEGATYTIIGAPKGYDATVEDFIGWVDADGNIVTGEQTMGAADVTYTAKFEEIVYYTVTYLVGEDTFEEPVSYRQNKDGDTTYTVKTNAPTKTGYTFAGWSTVADDATAIISGEQVITADVTLYAVYTANTYTATFDADGGKFADGETAYKYSVEYADYIVAPEAEPVKEGYTFAGWNGYTEGETKIDAADVTFKANWTANTYKATFYLDADAYAAGTATKTVDAKYNEKLDPKTSDFVKAGYKFAGWIDAATGEKAEYALANGTFQKYGFTSDKAFYADWTKYNSSITIMVRDYVNGEGWTVLETKYADSGATYTKTHLAAGKDAAAIMGWTGFKAVVQPNNLFTSEALDTAAPASIKFDGDAVYYLNTLVNGTVTFKSGDKTVTKNLDTATNPYAFTQNVALLDIDTTPATGYKFVGWADETGAVIKEEGKVLTFPVANGANQTVTAAFEKINYNLVFNVNNNAGYSAVKTSDKTFAIGDTISLDGVNFTMPSTDAEGNATTIATVLPTIGAENGAQVGGDLKGDDTRYTNKNGYKFVGWKLGVGAEGKDFAIDSAVVIDEEFIKSYAVGETIRFTGVWEALPARLEFYVVTGYNEDGTEIYELLKGVDSIFTGDKTSKYTEDAGNQAKENAPKGKTFIMWVDENGDGVPATMPAGVLKLYAKYQSESVKVFIDYNNSTKDAPIEIEERIKEGTFYNAYYGLDIMAKYPDGSDPLYDQIRRMTITNTPGENYACIGWDVYTVDTEENVYKEETWTKVELGESYRTNGILIFKANWKAYGDFFVRLYDTNHKMIKALGKDFKMYYWASGVATDKAGVDPVNHAPEGLVIVLYILKLETSGGLSLVIEPFAVNKTFFDITNIGALFEALGGLIGNLL